MHKIFAAALALLLGCAHAQPLQGRDFDGDGTADGYYDTAQNITWMADANLYSTQGGPLLVSPFSMPWNEPYYLAPGEMPLYGYSGPNALSWIETLVVGDIGGWRLPQRFVQQGSTDPALRGTCNLTACYEGMNWPTELSFLALTLEGGTGPFSNVMDGFYMAYNDATTARWAQLYNPITNRSMISDETSLISGYVWAVHDGDVGRVLPVTPVPEPGTYALMLAGLLGLGWALKTRPRSLAG